MGLAESWPVGEEKPSVVTTLRNSYLIITVVHGKVTWVLSVQLWHVEMWLSVFPRARNLVLLKIVSKVSGSELLGIMKELLPLSKVTRSSTHNHTWRRDKSLLLFCPCWLPILDI